MRFLNQRSFSCVFIEMSSEFDVVTIRHVDASVSLNWFTVLGVVNHGEVFLMAVSDPDFPLARRCFG